MNRSAEDTRSCVGAGNNCGIAGLIPSDRSHNYTVNTIYTQLSIVTIDVAFRKINLPLGNGEKSY